MHGVIAWLEQVRARRTFPVQRPVLGCVVAEQGQYLQRSSTQQCSLVPRSGWSIVERAALPNCARKRRGVVQFAWELAEGSANIVNVTMELSSFGRPKKEKLEPHLRPLREATTPT
ncbi:hypothetical protein Taro_014068 [Colocasia esculenta]|uniref:Uncharacterized protein n=1 Tax=Colocasia esculenta TaxID=4460 RepID=A0A843U849_COLES|nr:hypothetical protein [Colocasia esculenta]